LVLLNTNLAVGSWWVSVRKLQLPSYPPPTF